MQKLCFPPSIPKALIYLEEQITFRRILLFLGLCIFFMLLRRNNFNLPLTRDEGEYAYSAWLLKQNILPYAHSFMQKPPMIIYTYALAQLISPVADWAPRILSSFFLTIATILLGLVARLEFGSGRSWAVMWIFPPMVLLPMQVPQFTANVEMFILLPLIAMLTFYVYKKGAAHGWLWMCAGIFGAVALCYKYTVAPILLFIFIIWSVETWRFALSIKVVLKNILFGILGAVLASLTILGYFLLRDGGASLWDCTVAFNSYYAQLNAAKWGRFILFIKVFLENWWILFLFTLWYLLRRPRRWCFYVSLLLLALLGPLFSFFSHYFIPLMPFWALIVADSIHHASVTIAQWSSIPAHRIKMTLIIIVLGLLFLPMRYWFFLSESQFKNHFESTPMTILDLECHTIANKVSELSTQSDYVLVAHDEPQILYYAQRKSPTRFVISYPIMLNTPRSEIYQKEFILDLKRHPPKLIVLINNSPFWKSGKQGDKTTIKPIALIEYLVSELNSNRYSIAGALIRENEHAYWKECRTFGQIVSNAPKYFAVVYKKTA
jgi:hypothetical protein